ncbi:hypothetical protein HAX54_041218 [Datura stramonium]|uniref:Uncharacterized protein n=1 Tax=Datura stramonium TaxID=4076 RepID=A0ABS8VU27_DATST|nr:hypothetical protein [Datura stramonium]
MTVEKGKEAFRRNTMVHFGERSGIKEGTAALHWSGDKKKRRKKENSPVAISCRRSSSGEKGRRWEWGDCSSTTMAEKSGKMVRFEKEEVWWSTDINGTVDEGKGEGGATRVFP